MPSLFCIVSTTKEREEGEQMQAMVEQLLELMAGLSCG
jgi:hypothetical protein